MKPSAGLLIVSFLLICPQARSQTLVYSLSYVETRVSFHARFPNPLPFGRTAAENLAMLRHARKTEIYSVSVADGKPALLFSDAGTNLELKATGAVSPEGKAYVPGTWREEPPSPARGVVVERGIYEISLDGSNHFRRVLSARPNQPPPVLNRRGTRAAFEMFVKGEYIVSIYAVPEWKLLYTWDLARLTKAHCPHCDPLAYGWLADGKRLYFELGLVGEQQADHPDVRDTPYIVSENGADLGAVPPEFSTLRLSGYIQPPFAGRYLLGQLPDGSYLFTDFAVRKGKPFRSQEPFLLIFNPHTKSPRQFPLKSAIARGFVSPSGRYLAYLQRRQLPNYRVELHLRVKDLDSGEEKDVFVSPPWPNPPNSPKPNVILSILGWLN